MQLDTAPTGAVVARRRRLAERLGDVPALIFAGARAPRNYPAATYPFRASSHFLYLVGLPLVQSVLLVDGEDATIFTPPHDPAGELWHGPVPGPGEIGEAAGCAVADLDALGDAIAGRDVATLPAVDLATRLDQARRLGRPLEEPTEGDLRLADALIELRLIHDEAALRALRAAAEATEGAHRAG